MTPRDLYRGLERIRRNHNDECQFRWDATTRLTRDDVNADDTVDEDTVGGADTTDSDAVGGGDGDGDGDLMGGPDAADKDALS